MPSNRAIDAALLESLGEAARCARPEGLALLSRALTHRSLSGARDDYERLEFLGDRVLGLIVAEMLMQRFPDEEVGAINRRHAALVRQETLARAAQEVGLAPYIVLSEGEARGGGRENPAILADVMEAVIAVLYRLGGLEAARAFVERLWRPLMERDFSPPRDAKTRLQEWLQARGRALPVYRMVERSGPDHAPSFVIAVEAPGVGVETAEGPTKREAEQAAAGRLLERLEET